MVSLRQSNGQSLSAGIIAELKQAGHLAVVLSPHLTVEEAYLLATFVRDIDSQALLALGPIPMEGEDETFPSGFTIRAEKCPNRRGVEAVISGLRQKLVTFDDLVDKVSAEEFGAVWFTGGYKSDWIDPETAHAFDSIPLTHRPGSVLPRRYGKPPTYQLPGVAFAERAGSYVNAADRLQSFDWAIRPPAGAMSEGQFTWRLLRRPGLYNPQAVLGEVAGRDQLLRGRGMAKSRL